MVGLTWSDTRAAGLDMHRHSKHCTALLGAGENSIPMLPIDSGESDQKDPTKAMLSSMPPMGLLSSAVRFQQKRIDVDVPVTQRTTNRPGWNSRTREDNLRVTENPRDASFVAVLQKRNQSVENSVENINGERPRYAAASKKPLTKMKREQMLSRKHQERMRTMSIQSLDTDNLKASINQMILANERSVGGEVDEEREDPLTMVMRQLKVAMKRLEEEMLVTNREIDAMEEELEARYMLLEEEAEELDEEEYDRAMDFLDTESSNMETDKLRISELSESDLRV